MAYPCFKSSQVVGSISDQFPTPNRRFKIENGIESRETVSYLPVNSIFGTGEKYIEFMIPGSERIFVNTGKIDLELYLSITRADGTALDANVDRVSVIDGLGHTIISRSTVDLNSTRVEENPYKGLWSFVQTILTLSDEETKNIGRLNLYKAQNTNIVDTVTADYFSADELTSDESSIIKDIRTQFQTIIPLKLDISGSEFLLLDLVDIRIRLDIQNPNYMCLTHQNTDLKVNINKAVLHVEKVRVEANSLVSLNKRLLTGDPPYITYLYDKPIISTSVIPTGVTSHVINNVFPGTLPSKLTVFIISQSALNSSKERNPLYLQNLNISDIKVRIGGESQVAWSGRFPNAVGQYLSNTLKNQKGGCNTSLTYNNYKNGRTVFVFDLSATLSDDVVKLQKTGDLVVSIQLTTPTSENYVMFLVGTVNSIVNINTLRRVEVSN